MGLAGGMFCLCAASARAQIPPRIDLFALASRPSPQAQQRIPREAVSKTAALQGIVRDAQGNPVAEVVVSLRHATLGETRQATTNNEGIFRLRDLASGTYEIKFQKEGFEPLEEKDFVLQPGVSQVLEIRLKAILPAAPPAALPEACGPALGIPCRQVPAAPPLPVPPAAGRPYRELRRRTEAEPEAPVPSLPEESDVFIPMPDRWEIGYPDYRRYPKAGDLVYVKPHWYDPFNVNRLKGDKPIIGNNTFFAFTGVSETFMDGVKVPLPSNVAAARPGSTDFFGKGELYAFQQTFRTSFELFHGTTQAFRPVDWRIKVTPAFNLNYVGTKQNGIINVDVREGTSRFDTKSASLQDAFFEYRLKDLSPNFDVLFLRVGIQSFSSDFRGFIYVEEQPGARLFGNLHNNKWEYNLAYFYHLEKDTNSGLNKFQKRHQQVTVANLYLQDFLGFEGYTTEFSFHYNKEDNDFVFDRNGFLVRPAPFGGVHSLGQLQPHHLKAFYLGWAGQGHFRRLNVSHAFYQAGGKDSRNPLASRAITINAQMAAAELSYDRDWLRFRGSFFYASGDANPRDGRGRGFDSIVDSPTFAGGIFSFWNREGIRLTGSGVALTSGLSLLPALRSSNLKELSQSQFINPGIWLYNAGIDIEMTPKMRGFINVNYLRFDRTEPLELLLFQAPIRHGIGVDYSFGVSYRPPLSDNVVILAGVSSLQPGEGFRDIYTGKTLWSVFTSVRFLF